MAIVGGRLEPKSDARRRLVANTGFREAAVGAGNVAATMPAVPRAAGLLVQPQVVEAPVVVDAVVVQDEVLDVRLPAQAGDVLRDDRPGDVARPASSPPPRPGFVRFAGSVSRDCWSISFSTSGLQYLV